MVVFSRDEAFAEAGKLMKHDFEYDSFRSQRAGYPIYFSVIGYEWISDLGDRLEVNLEDGRSIYINIVSDILERLVKTSQDMGYTAF